MADTNSDLIAAQASALTGLANGIVNGDDLAGDLKLATVQVTLPSGVAGSDTFQLCDLPAGAVPVPQLSHATCPNPGTTLTLDIGYSDTNEGGSNTDADGLADGIVMSSGGQVGFCSATQPATVATPYRCTRKTRIYATAASASSVTAGVVVSFTIAYRVKG